MMRLISAHLGEPTFAHTADYRFWKG